MATPNTVIDLTGVIGAQDVTYNPATNTLTITYEDGTTKDIVLNDVSVSNVTLAGSELLVTKSDGTIYTQSLATFEQVQADWNQANAALPSYIANKPNVQYTAPIPEATNLITGLVTSLQIAVLEANALHAALPHAPATAEQNVQADWDVTDVGSDAYIVNKPVDLKVETAIYDSVNKKIVLTMSDFSVVDVDLTLLTGYVDTSVANVVATFGTDNGVATLDALGHIPAIQLPLPVTTRDDLYAAFDGQTSFATPYNVADFDVYVAGILLDRVEYTATDGLTVNLISGVDAGTWMLVKTTPTY